MKNCHLIVKYVSDKIVKNWNRMQNAADWGWVFYECEEYACMLYESVRYWYGICDVLVTFLRAVRY